jgi:hypothetical protein
VVQHLRDYGSLDPLRLHPAGAWCRPRPVPIENDDKAVRAELRISTRRLALEHAKILKSTKSTSVSGVMTHDPKVQFLQADHLPRSKCTFAHAC